MLCYAMLCYAMLCYAMLCYAMLCYATHVQLYAMLRLRRVGASEPAQIALCRVGPSETIASATPSSWHRVLGV
jgi:hypothetical protein